MLAVIITSFYGYHNVTFQAWPCGMAIVYALGWTSTCTTSIIMVKGGKKKPQKNILVASCFTKYYSITHFGVQLSLFLGDFSRVGHIFYFIFYYLFLFLILLGAKILHGCQIFEIFGYGFNDFFWKWNLQEFETKNHFLKKIARFLYLVQVGNHK